MKIRLSRVAKASIILMIGTVLSKMLGFARELMVAYRFGAGSISDAFVLTNSKPNLIFVSIATAININFIPYYHRINGEEEKNKFTSNMTNVILVILLIGCAIVIVFSKYIIKIFATGLPDDTEKYAIIMLRIVVFSVIPIMLSYLYQAYLQANGSFISTAAYGVLTNITVIIFTYISDAEKFYLLSIGTISSHAVGLFLIISQIKSKTNFRYVPYLRFSDEKVKDMILLTLPLMIEDLSSSMSLLVDRNLASFLDKGTISGLGYAGTLGNIASTMIASAIITASFPAFSKMLSEGQMELFSNQFEKYATLICYLLGPISVFMVLNSKDIVTLLFEHGAFDNAATKIVSESMFCYAVGVLPMGLQLYVIRGFYALQDTKTPVKIKVFSLACNMVLNILSVKYLKHMGIALSTSVSYLIAYILLANGIRKKHGISRMGAISFEGGVAVFVSLVVGMVWFILFSRFCPLSNLAIKLLIEGALFAICYFLLIAILRKDKVNNIHKIFK